ncbi:aldolase/citrate lyase family protein [Halorubrum gandharaense]
MELKRKLAAGDRPVGGWCSYPSPGVAEALAGESFDFLTIDTEHAPTTTESVENLIRAVEAAPGDTDALVRVAANDATRVKHALDAGAAGVMAPQVNDVDDARELVRAARYPPQGAAADGDPGAGVDADGVRGRRGVAGSRATDYGARIDEYVASANDEMAVIAQVETPRAVDAAAEIGGVPGIDALFVGPADLSAALGCFRDYTDPAFRDCIERTVAAADEAGVPVGTLATSDERIDAWLADGFDFLIVGTDAGYLRAGATASIERYEREIGKNEEPQS